MDIGQHSYGLACIRSKTQTQSCLCVMVCCHSMNIVPVCPMQALTCTQSVSKPHNLSHNQTDCPTQSLFVSKSDSLPHNQTVYVMHILLTYDICVLSLVILLLPWLILYTMSRSQTVCLTFRQCVSLFVPMRALSCTCSVFKSDCLSHACLAYETCILSLLLLLPWLFAYNASGHSTAGAWKQLQLHVWRFVPQI